MTSPRAHLCALVGALLIGFASSSAEAHLLNMTRATLTITPGGIIESEFEIDLSRAYPDRAAYYAASRLPSPEQDPAVQALVASLHAAIVIETDGNPPDAVPFESDWTLLEFAPERTDRARYDDPFHWPMTRIRAVAREPLRAEVLQVHFAPTFPFEEPIALTLAAEVDALRMTRWLVIDQRSPHFALDGAVPPAGSAPFVHDAPIALRPIDGLRLGFTHILPGGLDHVLFVGLLVLLCARIRPTLVAVTLFTLAHALTLTAVLLRWVPTPPAWIEAAIAASILWLAIDVVRGATWGWLHGALTLAFGLVHGLGFAAALSTQTLGTQSQGTTLLALNAGVEGAQLLVAGAALAGLQVLTRVSRAEAARRGTAAAAGLVAAFWVIVRL